MFSVISDNMIIFSEENYDFRNLKELTCNTVVDVKLGFFLQVNSAVRACQTIPSSS